MSLGVLNCTEGQYFNGSACVVDCMVDRCECGKEEGWVEGRGCVVGCQKG